MIVGVPKEIMHGERRVAATPSTVKKMVAKGCTVLVETGAGEGCYFEDQAYAQAGAQIVEDAETIFARADVILKVKQPQFNTTKGMHEAEMMKRGQVLITFLHPASPNNHEMVRKLAAAGVVSLTLDCVPRISRTQSMDALTSMSTVAGYEAFLIAASRLSRFVPMVATAVGMIEPANVLIVGAGVAGLQALATAKRLGGVVYAADIRPAACEQAKSLGSKIVELGIPEHLAMADGGYAKGLPDKWLERERQTLRDIVAEADVIILTALVPGKRAPLLVTGEMVRSMKPGSIIMDVAVDQGGNCELTQSNEVITQHAVTIDGTPNIPGMVPVSATQMFAENIWNYLSALIGDDRVRLEQDEEISGPCLVTRDGQIVHAGTLEAMRLT